MQGRIADHEPELAFGFPLKPKLDELVLASPVLISGNTVEANLAGANARARSGSSYPGIRLYAPGKGLFIFALSPFAGAVESQANWGKLDFNIEGQSYSLMCAAPITGGGQPRSLWVKRDIEYTPKDDKFSKGFLGLANPDDTSMLN